MVVKKRSASATPSALHGHDNLGFGPMNYCSLGPLELDRRRPKRSVQIWTWSRWWRLLRMSRFAGERELHSIMSCAAAL
eukprot:scaffold192172_cov37-Attheya_sp.AAC.1